ncbi:MAG: hypothetical protein JWO85_247 [Candidatus Eremiobacteraeota bacterium]|nr:hypothetical protein [Candidatus Eremiobacteraeota bacterium]
MSQSAPAKGSQSRSDAKRPGSDHGASVTRQGHQRPQAGPFTTAHVAKAELAVELILGLEHDGALLYHADNELHVQAQLLGVMAQQKVVRLSDLRRVIKSMVRLSDAMIERCGDLAFNVIPQARALYEASESGTGAARQAAA